MERVSEIIRMSKDPLKAVSKQTGYGFKQVLRKEMERNGLSKDVDGNEGTRKGNRLGVNEQN
jgi:hypothetical protein